MDILFNIDWKTVLITLAVVIVLWNTFQIIRYSMVRKNAEKEIKEMDTRLASINKEIEEAKKALVDKIKKSVK